MLARHPWGKPRNLLKHKYEQRHDISNCTIHNADNVSAHAFGKLNQPVCPFGERAGQSASVARRHVRLWQVLLTVTSGLGRGEMRVLSDY